MFARYVYMTIFFHVLRNFVFTLSISLSGISHKSCNKFKKRLKFCFLCYFYCKPFEKAVTSVTLFIINILKLLMPKVQSCPDKIQKSCNK